MTGAGAWWLIPVTVLAGGLGAGVRYLVDDAITKRWRGSIPVATLAINATGSFLLGVLVAATAHTTAMAHATDMAPMASLRAGGGMTHDELRSVFGTGLLGGYTTFSTACVEAARLCLGELTAGVILGRRALLRGIGYAAFTALVATGCAALGLWLGRFT